MPHKEKFVACYIDKFPHFGSTSISRVEGNHHVIKSYFCVGTLHLLTLTKRLGLMLANQRVELNDAIEKQRVHKAHLISLWTKFLQQLKHAEKGGHEEQPCSARFTKSWGLPYHHYIRGYLETETSILLQDIHE